MPITFSSREFDRNISRARRAADKGPAFITDPDRPAHVLLSIAEYRRITSNRMSIVELLASPDAADIDFAPPRLSYSCGKESGR